ncbi:MAG: parE1 [Thermomicrobiales bacterium]|jgi:toxin ParE1/3/4|nr:parE1 [Thermomicrobiales bacterium]MDF3038758.1 parE1 [Thermomicrobiales bacterium]
MVAASSPTPMSAPKKGVVLSAKAEADVNDILLFTWQRWGEEQRDRYEVALDRAIAALGDFPEVGSSVSRLFPGCRARHVGRHILYYRILDDSIEVVRILHERTDPTRHFQS